MARCSPGLEPHRPLPNVIAGFDPRPWEEQGPSFTAASRVEWTAALTQARELVTDPRNLVFGFPDAHGWRRVHEAGMRDRGVWTGYGPHSL